MILSKCFKALLSHLVLQSILDELSVWYMEWNEFYLFPEITLSHYHLLNGPSFSHCSWSLMLSLVSSLQIFVVLNLGLLLGSIVEYFPQNWYDNVMSTWDLEDILTPSRASIPIWFFPSEVIWLMSFCSSGKFQNQDNPEKCSK